ncbi:MAG TPA: hypothetical protein VNO20_00040 [Solirubrobacterales bacterium]|nr:hypothetical protein [Solirubrobacterales bacterium]
MSPLSLTALIASLATAVVIAAQPAAAAYSPFPTPGLAPLSATFEGEEAEAESEVEDWAEEEWEEEEEAEPLPGDVCPLRSASAHAVTKRDKLKLTIGYTTNEPFDARITIQRGSVQIGSVRRHLGHSGVFRFAEKLDERGGKIVANIAATGRSAGCPSRRLVLFPH